MKQFGVIILICLALVGCGGIKAQEPIVMPVPYKYMIIQNGPYNTWNGGPQWIYYCDKYEYVDGHYILYGKAGALVADFNMPPDHRIEIRLLKQGGPR